MDYFDRTKIFLASKQYGAPLLPNSFPELMFYIKLQLSLVLHKSQIWFENTYLHTYDNSFLNYLIIARDVFILYLISSKLSQLVTYIGGIGIIRAVTIEFHKVSKIAIDIFMSLPPIKNRVDKELQSVIVKMEKEIVKNDDELLQLSIIPEEGLSNKIVMEELDKLQTLKHTDWSNGRVSGAVYHGGDDLIELQSTAYHKYSVANQLHPDVFPGVRKMESEVVAMVLDIFNAPKDACGSTTSGGTESLLLTGLAAREYGKRYKGITSPEVIAPVTIHAGIEKACYYFGMTLHKVDVDPVTFKVDLKKVKRLINGNTVLLVGSAPNFPHGIIDDIEGLSKLAVKYKIPLHVDACLGSFIVSFLDRSKIHGDLPIPKFDFRVPGVTSISCDTHKYGFAPKGSSIIMYRNAKLRECQYYISSDWTGGMYGSPTLAGSRPGALMVGCWSTLISIGKSGYEKSCRDIVSTSMKFKRELKDHKILSEYFEVVGDPIASVVSFKANEKWAKRINIYDLGDSLSKKGWHFSTLQHPAALHFAFTRLTVPVIDELISDLSDTVLEYVETNVNDNNKPRGDVAALYGVAGSVATSGVADRLIVAFIDALYKI
ncbi:dihydrosphingosine-1-phosphate lyase [Scheffersomyces coipomensis]|uniref:dihydrosphingosine-1-phosphate lyase n=1 Tax=Scheffersomyces coipomensis TaxID=1788519 RepID=UPI00315DB1B8